ncbi:MAG: hypothetical protein QXD72_01920 [Candidatus Aenigmatarchaeota archaeon]
MSNLRLNKILIFYLLVVVIFLAGCAKKATITTNNGLSIVDFSPDLSIVGSNTPVTISLIVENVGEGIAHIVEAELIGLDDWTLNDDRGQLVASTLAAADLTNNIKGEQAVKEWKLVSPSKMVNQKYDFSVKLYYGYQTRSTILIRAMGLEYFKSLSKEEQSKIQQGIVSVSNTKGPLEISVKTQQTFLTQSSQLPIEIEIKNIGTGRAFLGGTKPTKENLDIVSITTTGVRCTKNGVKLTNGKLGKLVCYLDTSRVTTLQTFSIDVTIDYSYFVEKTSSITVLKSVAPIAPAASPPPTPTPTPPPTNPSPTAECDQKVRDAMGNKLECRSVSGVPVKICCFQGQSDEDCRSVFDSRRGGDPNVGEANYCTEKIKGGKDYCINGEGECKA